MAADVLSDRALNRATLARQLLLERVAMPPVDAVAHLVGLQAQEPFDPYLALWSRLDPFDPHEVGRLLEERALVRIVVMRGTIHLTTADDALVLRPLTQPVMDAEIIRHRDFGPPLVGLDPRPVLDFAHELLSREPHSTRALRNAIEARFPGQPAAALAYACRCLLPLVQVPPRGVWGRTRQVTLAPLDTWVGRPLRTDAGIDDVVLRYLAAFGPATPADVAAWCRLTGMREVVDRLRPRLRPFTDERGRALVDLPDAPRPDPDTPAPVRILPEYDNVLLAHADRARFDAAGDPKLRAFREPYRGTALVDGVVAAGWQVAPGDDDTATMVVGHLPLPARHRRELEAEARRAIRFWRPDAADHDVRLVTTG